jgi:hypothetical protein
MINRISLAIFGLRSQLGRKSRDGIRPASNPISPLPEMPSASHESGGLPKAFFFSPRLFLPARGPEIRGRFGRFLVVRPPWNAMFVFQFLRVKSHIAAVNSAWIVH